MEDLEREILSNIITIPFSSQSLHGHPLHHYDFSLHKCYLTFVNQKFDNA